MLTIIDGAANGRVAGIRGLSKQLSVLELQMIFEEPLQLNEVGSLHSSCHDLPLGAARAKDESAHLEP